MAQQDGQVLTLAIITNKCLWLRFALSLWIDPKSMTALWAAAPRAEHALHLFIPSCEVSKTDHAALSLVLSSMLKLLFSWNPMEYFAAVVNLRPLFHAELKVDCIQRWVIIGGISEVKFTLGYALLNLLHSLSDDYALQSGYVPQ
mgnify:CR=1 FL=1